MEMVFSRPGRFNPAEFAPGTHCTRIGGWVDPTEGPDITEKRKILPLSGIEPRPSSPPLYRLSYLERMILKWILKMGYQNMNFIHVTRDIWAVVNKVMNLRIP
jgi:hypothetical protein